MRAGLLFSAVILFAGIANAGTSVDGLYLNTFGDASKPPIIFVHGGPGYNSGDFEMTTAEPLANLGYFVVVYDERGQGRSESAIGSAFTYKIYADDLYKIITNLKLKEPVIIGHSHGGPIAIKFTEFYPDIAKAVVLVSAPINFWSSMTSLYENCSARYKARGNVSFQKDLDGNFQKVSATRNASVDLINPVNRLFTHGLFGCKLYSTSNPTVQEKALRNEIKNVSVEETSMPGFLLNENYIYLDHSNQVVNNKGRFFGIYGDEDGLFGSVVRDQIKQLVSDNKTNRFYLVHGASHGLYIDQQQEFLRIMQLI